MRITILTLGSRGDVQPYLALGLGLQQAGHQVKLAAPANFASWISSYGIPFAPIRFDAQGFVNSPEIQQSKGNIIRLLMTVRHIVGPLLAHVFDDLWAASQDAEALLISPAAHGAYDCAQKLGIPLYVGWLQPPLPTRTFPSFGFHLGLPLGRLYNHLTYLFFEQALWQSVRPWLTPWRKKVLGLQPLPLTGPYVQMRRQRIPYLIAYSPLVVPRPVDWNDHAHVTGYWFLDAPPGWTPPERLQQFLNNGPPPVYVGFGSMSRQDPRALTQLAVSALQKTGQRGLLLAGWGALIQEELPETMLAIDAAPHDWLFPRVAAVVHHGGAGTTGAALRAGVPAIVTPFAFDQYDWAGRVAALGVGLTPASVHKLTAEKLATAIDRVIHDQTIRSRAADLSHQIRGEDGITQAIRLITAN